MYRIGKEINCDIGDLNECMFLYKFYTMGIVAEEDVLERITKILTILDDVWKKDVLLKGVKLGFFTEEQLKETYDVDYRDTRIARMNNIQLMRSDSIPLEERRKFWEEIELMSIDEQLEEHDEYFKKIDEAMEII